MMLAAAVAAGILIHAVLRAVVGASFDVTALAAVASGLAGHPLHVYSIVNYPAPLEPDQIFFQWPYPPGFFPWIWISNQLHRATSVPFDLWVRIPNVVAQAALAYLVQAELGRRGYAERRRVVSAALIAMGPLFIVDSVYAQIDSLAIFPAVLAVAFWSAGHRRRSVTSGLLIGIGAALKTVPILVLLALLPTARNNRERAELIGTAIVVPLVTMLPFLARDPSGVLSIRRYTGIPGVGGMTMLMQPHLLRFWLYGDLVFPTTLVHRVMTYGSTLLVIALLFLLAGLSWRRVDALTAATMTWLVVYVLGPSPTPLYLCLGVPFFLLAGRIRLAAGLQTLALAPAVLLYLHAPVPHRIPIYLVLMGLVWVACLAALVIVGVTAWHGPAGAPRKIAAVEKLTLGRAVP